MDELMKLADEYAEAVGRYVSNKATLGEVADARTALQSKLGDAIRSLANWQHQCEEAQAENERLKDQIDCFVNGQNQLFEVAKILEDERDALQAKLDVMGKGAPDGNALLQAIARGWCSEKNSGKVMDALLALAIRDEVQKLYAAPKALAPLSRDDVKRICAEADYTHESAQSKADFINGIRHGEKAHGIGGTP